MTDTGNELSEILSAEPAPAETTGAETTTTTTAETGQGRDEQGRFANKAGDTSPATTETPANIVQPVATTEEQPGATVPLAALHAERQKNADLGRQIAELNARFDGFSRAQPRQAPAQQQEQPVAKDIWDSPEEFTDTRVRTALDPIQKQLIFNARLVANAVNGEDKVNAAMTAFDDLQNKGQLDPAERARVFGSPNPFHAAVDWHKRHSAITRVGNDPDAWLEAEMEKRLSDPAQQAAILARIQASAAQPNANRSTAPVTALPPSLSKIPGGANEAAPGLGDDSDRFARALAAPR